MICLFVASQDIDSKGDAVHDYEALDLSTHYNAGLAILGPGATAPTGRQSFRGLPFVVGDDQGRCFLALGGSLDREAVTLPIGRAASLAARSAATSFPKM